MARHFALLPVLIVVLALSLTVAGAGHASAVEPDDAWILPFAPLSVEYDEASEMLVVTSSRTPETGFDVHAVTTSGSIAWSTADLDVVATAINNGQLFVSSAEESNQGAIHHYDLATGALVETWTLPGLASALDTNENSIWFEHSVPNGGLLKASIGRLDLSTDAIVIDVIEGPSMIGIGLVAVAPNGQSVWAHEFNDTVRFDLSGPSPVETHRASLGGIRFSDDRSAIFNWVGRTLNILDSSDFSLTSSTPNPEFDFSSSLVERPDGSVFSESNRASRYRFSIFAAGSLDLIGSGFGSIPDAQDYAAVGNRIAVIPRGTNELQIHTIRPTINAASLGPVEADNIQEITLTGDFLASTTSVNIGGTPAPFTIIPGGRPFVGAAVELASVRVSLPSLTVGNHMVSVTSAAGTTLDSPENELTISPALLRHDLTLLLRSDSFGEDVTAWVGCVSPAGEVDFSVNSLMIQRGLPETFGVLPGDECSVSFQRNDDLIGGDETHLSAGFFNPGTDATGMTAIDLETHDLDITMPAQDIAIAIYLPSFEQRVLWTYGYGVGTPGTGTPTVTIDCPGTANDDAYDLYYGNYVRSVVPREETCWLNHSTPAGAEVSGFGYFDPSGGTFTPPRTASERTPASGLSATTLVIIYDIYPHPSEHNGAFARQQYLDFLGRHGDPGGLRFWEDALNAGTRGRTDLVQLFLDSPEFGGTVAPVNRLYSAYFDRAPDRQGLFFWVDWIRGGRTLGAVSDEFARSPEFIAAYGSLSDEAFIDLVYQNVLGRLPDDAGRRFWVDRMASGLSRGELMVGFSESPEYIEETGSAVLVESLYQGLLQRSPDPQGFEYWTGIADSGATVTNLIAGMLSSDEYYNRFDNIIDDLPAGGARSQRLHYE